MTKPLLAIAIAAAAVVVVQAAPPSELIRGGGGCAASGPAPCSACSVTCAPYQSPQCHQGHVVFRRQSGIEQAFCTSQPTCGCR
jgi:hypothetical protein